MTMNQINNKRREGSLS